MKKLVKPLVYSFETSTTGLPLSARSCRSMLDVLAHSSELR